MDDAGSSVKGNPKSLAVHGATDTGFGLDDVDKPVDKTDESGVDRLRYDLVFEPEPDGSLPAPDEDEDTEAEWLCVCGLVVGHGSIGREGTEGIELNPLFDGGGLESREVLGYFF